MVHKLTVKNYVKYLIAVLIVILIFLVVRQSTEFGIYSTSEFKLSCEPNIGLSILTNDKKEYTYSREYSQQQCQGLNTSSGKINFKYQKSNNYLVSVVLNGNTVLSYERSFGSMVIAITWTAGMVVMFLLGADIESIRRK